MFIFCCNLCKQTSEKAQGKLNYNSRYYEEIQGLTFTLSLISSIISSRIHKKNGTITFFLCFNFQCYKQFSISTWRSNTNEFFLVVQLLLILIFRFISPRWCRKFPVLQWFLYFSSCIFSTAMATDVHTSAQSRKFWILESFAKLFLLCYQILMFIRFRELFRANYTTLSFLMTANT